MVSLAKLFWNGSDTGELGGDGGYVGLAGYWASYRLTELQVDLYEERDMESEESFYLFLF